MCLVGIAWQSHPRYPLIIAGNRDEFHARPTAGADWWHDASHVFGGRDLVAGGSWLAVSRAGRFAVVTNQPERPAGAGQPASRGALVRDWVTGSGDLPEGFLRRVNADEARYGGFCLVVGALRGGFEGLIVPPGLRGPRWRLPFGITALANAPRERPPPKALWLEREYQRILGADAVTPEELLAPLSATRPVTSPVDDESPAGRARVTPFVLGEDFGTRSSTLILVDADDRCQVIERRYDAAGRQTGESSECFGIVVPGLATAPGARGRSGAAGPKS
jgi:uncharacterized protein with NRDE domain